ncbi:MAG: YdcF family protein [Maricaulis sp.]|jgi:uncharacterized SAM-binding protein YcdF (DUF218 family)|nr:YdcF family protein [Maricaulis sp.]MDG2045492.1 YdcF family protein [Maricaulis sp.]
MNRLLGALRAFSFVFVMGGLIGFGAFSGLVSGFDTPDASLRADAIVVLTGDTGRLATGGELFRSGTSPQLLISGVHASVTAQDIQEQTGVSDRQFNCCVELGREAADTAGNALETAEWVNANGYQSLIIVTSDYHLPRSMLEMGALMPELELIAVPVRTNPPWRDLGTARLWLQEYAKFAAVWMYQEHRQTRNNS